MAALACRWTATFQSSHQMENFGKLAKSKGMQQRAHARLCGWLDLRTVLSSTQQYSSILAIDPATMATVQAKQITEFYQVLSDCTAPGGTVTVLALYAAKDLAAADSHRGSFFKNEFCPVSPCIPSHTLRCVLPNHAHMRLVSSHMPQGPL